MTTFSGMTDGDLRRWIAERLGYTVVQYFFGGQVRPIDGERPCWILLGPAPKYEHVGGIKSTIDGPWYESPNWPASTDAALGLPRNGYKVRMVVRDDAAVVAYESIPFSYRGKAAPDKLARAICEAWAQMKEAEGKGDDSH